MLLSSLYMAAAVAAAAAAAVGGLRHHTAYSERGFALRVDVFSHAAKQASGRPLSHTTECLGFDQNAMTFSLMHTQPCERGREGGREGDRERERECEREREREGEGEKESGRERHTQSMRE